MNPADKRLAIRTEDHPFEYADFEGVIPEGQYGAGPVMVWDKGTYEPEGDIPPDKQLARGKIDVVLQGEKLRGGFTLIQTGRRSAGSNERKRWLLIKHRDEYADLSWDIDSPELDRSVLTGRTLNEIAESRPKKAPIRIARQQARSQDRLVAQAENSGRRLLKKISEARRAKNRRAKAYLASTL